MRNLLLKVHFLSRRRRTSIHSARFAKSSAVLNLSHKNAHDSLQKKLKKLVAQEETQKLLIKKLPPFVKKKHNFAALSSKLRTYLQHQLQHLQLQRLHSKQKKTPLQQPCVQWLINVKVLLAKKVISNLLQRALKLSPKRLIAFRQPALKHNHVLILQRAIMQNSRWRLVTPMLASRVLIHNLMEQRTHSMQQRKLTLN